MSYRSLPLNPADFSSPRDRQARDHTRQGDAPLFQSALCCELWLKIADVLLIQNLIYVNVCVLEHIYFGCESENRTYRHITWSYRANFRA